MVSESFSSGLVPAYNLVENLHSLQDGTAMSNTTSFTEEQEGLRCSAALGVMKPALFIPLKDPHLLGVEAQAVLPNNPPQGTAGVDNTSSFPASLVEFGISHEV